MRPSYGSLGSNLYLFGSTAPEDSDVDRFFDYERGKLGLFCPTVSPAQKLRQLGAWYRVFAGRAANLAMGGFACARGNLSTRGQPD